MSESENTLSHKLKFDLRDAFSGLKGLKSNLMNVANSLKLTKKTMKDGQQSISLDARRIGASFALLGTLAGGALNAMISNSPLLGAQVARLTFEFNLLFMELGNALAPVLEPLVEWLISAIKWFQDLSEPVQTFIALTIGLTAAIVALVPVVILLQTVSLPLLATILLIAAAIAALILIWQNWDEIVRYFTEDFVKMLTELPLIGPIIELLIGAISALTAVTSGLGDVWNSVVGGMNQAWQNMVDSILKGWEKLKEAYEGVKSYFEENAMAIGNALGDSLGVPSFDTGAWSLPNDTLAMVHKGEMIIPAGPAESIRRNGFGGGPNINISIQIDSPIIRSESDLEEMVSMIEESVSRSIVEKLNRTSTWG